MEWVVTTGKTLDEARDSALDQLGVHGDDAEFEVVEEPRPGLFGRTRGEYRVRARVRPETPRPKVERRDRRRGKGDGAGSGAASSAGAAAEEGAAAGGGGRSRGSSGRGASATRAEAEPRAEVAVGGGDVAVAQENEPAARRPRRGPKAAPAASEREEQDNVESNPQEEADRAAAFLLGLAGAFGLQASTEIEIVDEDIEVRLVGDDLGLLIGPRGQTLTAIQDLTRTVANRAGSSRTTTLRIDVGGYRARRRVALARFTEQVAADVLRTGTAKAMEPMSAADRKVVHDTAGGIDGVTTSSEGEDPRRFVVLRPSDS